MILKLGSPTLQYVDSVLFFYGVTAPSVPGLPHCQGLTLTLRHISFGMTPLDE